MCKPVCCGYMTGYDQDIYVYIYIHTHPHIYIYIYIHTHIYIRKCLYMHALLTTVHVPETWMKEHLPVNQNNKHNRFGQKCLHKST